VQDSEDLQVRRDQMSVFARRKLHVALFLCGISVCPQFCVAGHCEDIDLQYRFWTSFERMNSWESQGILFVTLTWKHPNFSIDHYRTYRNSSQSQLIGGGTSYIWRMYTWYFRGSNHNVQFEAAVEHMLNQSHSFGIKVTPADGSSDVYCYVTYEPPPLTAWAPQPADGSTTGERTMILRWEAGRNAISHDVYFGDNLADVNDGAAGTFCRNQDTNFLLVGLGESVLPDGLTPATTYYWRVDELDKDDARYKGDVWSFTIPGQASYEPVPVNGAKFLDPDVELSWKAGFEAVLHDIYIGTNLGQVDSANVSDSSGVYLGRLTDPNHFVERLDKGRIYYWRVDEVEADGFTSHKGDVWSFETAAPGGGLQGDYFEGTDLTNHVLSRIDPQIDFNIGTDRPAEGVGRNNFSVVWTGELEAAFTETYKFFTNSDNGVRLWIDGRSIVDNWTEHEMVEDEGTIDLVAGKRYFLEMWWYEMRGEAVAQLSWESPRTPRQIVPQGAFSPPVHARSPSPADGAGRGQAAHVLSWIGGNEAVEHDVYFGTDLRKLTDADGSDSTGAYRGRQAETSYVVGELDRQTYYWRIDEVEADGITIHKGDIWTFTVADVAAEQVEYQVSSGDDDGYAVDGELDNLTADFLRVGSSSYTEPPYYRSAMVFRGVNIPQDADIVSAYLTIRSYDSHLTDTACGKIQAVATDDAAVPEGLLSIGSMPAAGASVDWVLSEPWSAGVWYDSPDIADIVQEIIHRPGWSAGNSLAILYGTWWARDGYRNFSSYEHGSGYAPKLEITYIPR
jgi:hypothetical protein